SDARSLSSSRIPCSFLSSVLLLVSPPPLGSSSRESVNSRGSSSGVSPLGNNLHQTV
ncbi:hypothetical protein ATANTOWER_011473, partial [Ataeniobius toweri]|nr:hypothetical protein [Ataeniobius toweri]